MKKIKKIHIIQNYRLRIEFVNNVKNIFDLKPYLDKGIFQELKDLNYLSKIKNRGYFIEWPNEQDLSSDTLYYHGIPVNNEKIKQKSEK